MADNQAWAILPHREVRPVTLVTDGNLFLEKVFEANPLVRLTVVRALPPAPALPAGGLTVLHRKVPARLPVGPVLVIEPSSASDLWQLGETLESPIVAQQDKDSPLMAHVRLDNVLMPEARKLTVTVKEPMKTNTLVASAGGEPLYLAIDRPEGKVLVLTVNLDKGDLPLQTAFPIMVANALGWFSGNKGELREAVASGALTEFDLPGAGTYDLHRPDGPTQPLPNQGTRVTLGPLDHCGVWSVARRPGSGEGSAREKAGPKPDFEVACNLASRRESDLRPPKKWTPKADLARGGFGGRPIWYGLIIGAWALVSAEWFLYQRRWIS
jgi:hypothetical protein